ncbi:MAG: hypothetical protein V4507_10820 [Verrucomicrobiota bacterium]
MKFLVTYYILKRPDGPILVSEPIMMSSIFTIRKPIETADDIKKLADIAAKSAGEKNDWDVTHCTITNIVPLDSINQLILKQREGVHA